MNMKEKYFVDVTEVYTARIQVEAESEANAEIVADELVGGGKINIVALALQSGPNAKYSKECKVVYSSVSAQ